VVLVQWGSAPSYRAPATSIQPEVCRTHTAHRAVSHLVTRPSPDELTSDHDVAVRFDSAGTVGPHRCFPPRHSPDARPIYVPDLASIAGLSGPIGTDLEEFPVSES
jgi:hypothetical protein